jgi:hypothetical protein
MITKCQQAQAKLDILDYFLNSAIRDIYDNVGQVLSLVIVNLEIISRLENGETAMLNKKTSSLVSQCIRDLRAMTAIFQPESRLKNIEGFVSITSELVKSNFPEASFQGPKTYENIGIVEQDYILILFSFVIILIESVSRLDQQSMKSIMIDFKENVVLIDCHFLYSNILTLPEYFINRVKELNGRIEQTEISEGVKRIVIFVPLN